MVIRILFFGGAADSIGSRDAEMEVNGRSSVREVIDRLLHQHPQLLNRKLLSAVNEEYTDSEAILKEGDELAIFSPVSGG